MKQERLIIYDKIMITITQRIGDKKGKKIEGEDVYLKETESVRGYIQRYNSMDENKITKNISEMFWDMELKLLKTFTTEQMIKKQKTESLPFMLDIAINLKNMKFAQG